MLDAATSLVLVLSGGNALGAYQAGGYEALHDRGLRPDWIVGASTGAINGAIIAGNAPAERVDRLKAYWQPGEGVGWGWPEDVRRSAAVALAMTGGQPNIFVPRLPAWPWLQSGAVADPSLYDTRPLDATLRRLVDFDRLNGGEVRFTATAVDLESGEPVAFDTGQRRVDAVHVRASSALLPAFPPVEIDGRLLGDGGLTANLPVDLVLAAPPERPTLCFALDLLPLAAPRPATLGEAAGRMQDLMFAAQSRLALAAGAARFPARRAMTLLHLTYDRQAAEVAGKAFDYSPGSVRARWAAGYADVAAALDRVADGRIAVDRGLTIWRPGERAAAGDAAG